MTLESRVFQITEYELVDTPEAFVAAISALADRTEREGHGGVLGYQFYVDRETLTAGAVIQYADAAAWVAHHQMAYQWDEMPILQATVSLSRLTLFGPLNDELEGWLDGAEFPIARFGGFAAGFVR